MKLDKQRKISFPILALWIVMLIAMAVFACQPEADRVKRICTVGLVAGIAGTLLAVAWPHASVRKCLLLAAGLLAVIFATPWGERTSSSELRACYVEELNSFEGSPYYWGGESRRAIDCSGLIRRGLIDACFQKGVSNADPGLIRRGFSLWWHDTSAQALGEQHQGLTKLLFTSPDLKTLDHSRLMPGDFAVTDDGVHALAYIGEAVWIEADPGKLKVIKVHAPTTTNGWFLHPVKLLRWSRLEQ